MFERKGAEDSNYLKPEFYNDSTPVDFLITFQPKSAPSHSQQPRLSDRTKPKLPNPTLQVPRPRNRTKILPPLPKPVLTNSTISISAQKTRFSSKSDSKPVRPKKPEVLEAMNSSFVALKDFLSVPNDKKNLNGIEEMFMMKTPTFNGEEERVSGFCGQSQSFKENLNGSQFEGLDEWRQGCKGSEPSSASKYSAIGSSVSTEFPLVSPRSVQDQQFFRNYGPKVLPAIVSREHPKIRVRKTGLPKDVFTIKH